jgi:hypothetical protein
MRIEKTEIWITCEKPLQSSDGRAVRGFFGNMYRNRPEFHGHRGDKLIYKHPLVQYKVFGGSALVIGLKEGAYLLKAVPEIEYLELYFQKYPVVKQNKVNTIVNFGIGDNMISYTFLTPWIGLNKDNYEHYLQLKKRRDDTTGFLNKILTSNIISMCKAIGYTTITIYLQANLKECPAIEIKKGVKLTAFEGEFETNFLIPEFWGIGGKVSLGYGTVMRRKGGETE